MHGVPARQPDIKEEKKGPRVGAPENAIAGFLKAAGLKSISEAKVQPDKKGDFYVAVIEKTGQGSDRCHRRRIAPTSCDLSVAEIDALGRSIGETRIAFMGASAAFHHRDLWTRNRRA